MITCGSQFSPSILWVPRIKYYSSCLVAWCQPSYYGLQSDFCLGHGPSLSGLNTTLLVVCVGVGVFCLLACLCTCLLRPKEGIRSSGPGLTSGCGLMWSRGTKPRSPTSATGALSN